jgi:hypothetical protein
VWDLTFIHSSPKLSYLTNVSNGAGHRKSSICKLYTTVESLFSMGTLASFMSELGGLRGALRNFFKAHFQENRRSRSSEAEICSGTHSERFLSAGQRASRRTPEENALLMAEEYSAGRLITTQPVA